MRAGLAAHAIGDWRGLVSLIETTSLDRWRSEFVERNTHVRSVDDWRDEFTDISPDALAAFAEREAAPIRTFVAQLASHVAGVHTLAALAELSSAEVFIRVLQARDHIEALNRIADAAYDAAGTARPETTHYRQPSRHFAIVGQERVSDSEVRIRFRDETTGGEDVWTTTREGAEGWALVMGAELLDLPGYGVTYIDDPVIAEFLRQQPEG